MSAKYVCYYRVSTRSQFESRLGLDAQKHDVERYCASGTIVASYTEAESAWKDSLKNRPQLRKAVAHAKAAKAVLVIAKLDRLCRSVFVTQLLKRSGVQFACVDMPSANPLTIDIIAAVNEDESRRISMRTRAAMAAAKRNGRTFGTPANLNPTEAHQGRLLGAKAAREAATEAYEHIAPFVTSLKAKGASNTAIAHKLNELGYVTRRNCAWNIVQVARVLARA
jgi:DNA invertase Pin-like site-specific DNA recombinase